MIITVLQYYAPHAFQPHNESPRVPCNKKKIIVLSPIFVKVLSVSNNFVPPRIALHVSHEALTATSMPPTLHTDRSAKEQRPLPLPLSTPEMMLQRGAVM